jgi:hypothetical protein
VIVGYNASKRAAILMDGADKAGIAWAKAADLDTKSTIWSGPSIVAVAVVAPTLLTIGWGCLFIIFLIVS